MTERVDKYWLCDDCAKAKGAVTPKGQGAITVRKGLCGHCDRKDEVCLTPEVDFDWPDGRKAWFD